MDALYRLGHTPFLGAAAPQRFEIPRNLPAAFRDEVERTLQLLRAPDAQDILDYIDDIRGPQYTPPSSPDTRPCSPDSLDSNDMVLPRSDN